MQREVVRGIGGCRRRKIDDNELHSRLRDDVGVKIGPHGTCRLGNLQILCSSRAGVRAAECRGRGRDLNDDRIDKHSEGAEFRYQVDAGNYGRTIDDVSAGQAARGRRPGCGAAGADRASAAAPGKVDDGIDQSDVFLQEDSSHHRLEETPAQQQTKTARGDEASCAMKEDHDHPMKGTVANPCYAGVRMASDRSNVAVATSTQGNRDPAHT